MHLILQNDINKSNSFWSEFIEDFKEKLKSRIEQDKKKEQEKLCDEYRVFENKRIFLDNNSYKSNNCIWIVNDSCVCISEHGSNTFVNIEDVELPIGSKVGDVYERIDGEYVYNSDMTIQLNEIK